MDEIVTQLAEKPMPSSQGGRFNRPSVYDQERRMLLILVSVCVVVAAVYWGFRAYGKGRLDSPKPVPAPALTKLPQIPIVQSAAEQPSIYPAEPEPMNLVITKDRTYVIPPSDSDSARVLAIYRQNCHAAARHNADGQSPSMQRQACNQYLNQARQMGVAITDMPRVREAPARFASAQVTIPSVSDNSKRSFRSNCASLYSEKRGIESRMRRLYSAQEGELLNERMRQVTKRLWDLRCTETSVD